MAEGPQPGPPARSRLRIVAVGIGFRGVRIDLGDITDTAILAIEGERDDISGLGQTKAALTCAVNLPDAMKRYHMAPAVGHYGIFNGSKWRTKIAPVVEEWIADHNG